MARETDHTFLVPPLETDTPRQTMDVSARELPLALDLVLRPQVDALRVRLSASALSMLSDDFGEILIRACLWLLTSSLVRRF